MKFEEKQSVKRISSHRFYVYLHFTSTGEPFYCGMGQKDRWRSSKCRSIRWQNICKRRGFYPVRVAFFGTKEEAYAFERTLIRFFRLNRNSVEYEPFSGFACNMTDGGSGGQTRDPNKTYRHTAASKKKMSLTRKGKPGCPKLKQRHHRYDDVVRDIDIIIGRLKTSSCRSVATDYDMSGNRLGRILSRNGVDVKALLAARPKRFGNYSR